MASAICVGVIFFSAAKSAIVLATFKIRSYALADKFNFSMAVKYGGRKKGTPNRLTKEVRT